MEPIILEPQPSWLARNWKWLVPVGCLGTLVLSVGCCGGIFGVVFYSLKNSWAYAEGVELARHDPAVVAELGEPIEGGPIEGGWLVSGSINVTPVSGDANLAIPLAGPKQKGTLYVVAQKQAGQWRFTQARVDTAVSGKQVDLLRNRN
jgi:hypothetical protein